MVESVPVTACSLPGLTHVSSGKVREIFEVGGALLIVTTDRLSAFDVVMANGIPFKGPVLNRLSEFWFGKLGVPHHMLTCEVEEMPPEVRRHAEVVAIVGITGQVDGTCQSRTLAPLPPARAGRARQRRSRARR
jgi:phosphoribosylaminoimidazole-succinocarboxamide synthase